MKKVNINDVEKLKLVDLIITEAIAYGSETTGYYRGVLDAIATIVEVDAEETD